MQFVSFFGMPLPAIPKGQTGLWVALVGLLFSSILCAQGVDVIDHKGTKNTITTVSADTGNLITTGSDEGAFIIYQNFRSKAIVEEVSSSRYYIGLPGPGIDLSIDDADILFFKNPGLGSTTPITVNDLNPSYDGKIITIVEYLESAPNITINGVIYQDTSGNNTNLFIHDSGKFTSVSFIWVADKDDWYILQ